MADGGKSATLPERVMVTAVNGTLVTVQWDDGHVSPDRRDDDRGGEWGSQRMAHTSVVGARQSDSRPTRHVV
jgi:hypothetical protein